MWGSSSRKKKSSSKGKKSEVSEWSEWKYDEYGRVYQNRQRSDGTWEFKFAEQPRTVPEADVEDLAARSRGQRFDEGAEYDENTRGNVEANEEPFDEEQHDKGGGNDDIDDEEGADVTPTPEGPSYRGQSSPRDYREDSIHGSTRGSDVDPFYGHKTQEHDVNDLSESLASTRLSQRPAAFRSQTDPSLTGSDYSYGPSLSYSTNRISSLYSASTSPSTISSFSESTTPSVPYNTFDQNALAHSTTTEENLDAGYEEYSASSTATEGRYIRTMNDSVDTDLDKHFKVFPSKAFKFGRVFKILWTEPQGMTKSNTRARYTDIGEFETKYGEKAYASIRRFIVIRSKSGHSLCVPILTYENKATTKRGVKPQEHAIVYVEEKSHKWSKPKEIEGEERLRKKAIRIEPETPRDKLSPLSRINYAKIYTVEHNVKVKFIGRVHPKSIPYFNRDYNVTNVPLPENPNAQFSDEEDGEGAELQNTYDSQEPSNPIDPGNKHYRY